MIAFGCVYLWRLWFDDRDNKKDVEPKVQKQSLKEVTDSESQSIKKQWSERDKQKNYKSIIANNEQKKRLESTNKT